MRRVLLLLVLLLPRVVLAHATQPAAWQVLSQDAAGPTAIRLSEGLGLREASGQWRFVCSAHWLGPVSPPMARMADGTFWLVSSDGERQLDAHGQLLRAIHVGGPGDTVHAFAATAELAVVLASDATGAALTLLDSANPRLLWQDAQPWTALTADGTDFWLAAARGDGLDLARVQADGHATLQHLVAPAGTPRLHVSAGTLFATIFDGTSDRVGRVVGGAWQEVATSPPTVLGPEVLADRVFAAQGGVIRALTPTGAVNTDDARFFTCLDELDGLAYACARQDLRRLNADGTATQVLFDVAELAPPVTDGLEAPQQADCWTQWQNFSKDAGLPLGVFQSAQVDAAPGAPGGCTAQRQGESAGLLLAIALIMLVNMRRV